MADRRRSPSLISPEVEDRGLFKTYGGPIAVDLAPQMTRTARGDVLIRGFFNGDVEITVAILGRRAKEFGPLEAQLRWLETQTQRATAAAAAAGRPPPSTDKVRLPVQIKGSWKQKFHRRQDGSETRSYQLIAARWAFADRHGSLVQFGEAPVCVPKNRDRPKSYILQAREIDAIPPPRND